jgi:hypothetical protein
VTAALRAKGAAWEAASTPLKMRKNVDQERDCIMMVFVFDDGIEIEIVSSMSLLCAVPDAGVDCSKHVEDKGVCRILEWGITKLKRERDTKSIRVESLIN